MTLWDRRRILFLLILLCAGAPLAVLNGLRQDSTTDFYVFWNAGRHFFQGEPLYIQPAYSQYIYPPFAAMVFQLFAILPVQIAGGLFYLLNAALWVLSIVLTHKILTVVMPGRRISRLRKISRLLTLSVLLTASYFFMNMNAGQSNQIIFVLCLTGIYCFLKERWIFSSLAFVCAVFIKVTPVFFILWHIIRRGRQTILPTGIIAVMCFSAPFFLRGISNGIQDHKDYYEIVFKPFLENKVIPNTPNQSLTGLFYRIFRPYENKQHYNYAYFPQSEGTARVVYKTASVITFLAFLLFVVFRAVKCLPVTGLELCSVFLASHLLSTITWRVHLVSLLFIFTVFFLIEREKLTKPMRIFLYCIYGMIAFISVTSQDIMGIWAYYHLSGYSIVGWTLVLLFISSLWFSGIRNQKSG